MAKYLTRLQGLLGQLDRHEVRKVPRIINQKANLLAKLASERAANPDINIHFARLLKLSYNKEEIMETSGTEGSWFSPILRYLKMGLLPQDKREARKVRYRSNRYLLQGDVLYKRGFTFPLLRCLTLEEGEYVLREIHEGVCGNHSGPRSLAEKALRQGYYWPTMKDDARALVRRCQKCQFFSRIPRRAPEDLNSLISPWPFAQWGIDLIGPLPMGKGQVKYAVVAIDYFTKWAEAEPLATITEKRVTDFVWRSIVCRFGVPHTIITDNGKQFDNTNFWEFCSNLGIKVS